MGKIVLINPPHAGSFRSAFMQGDSLALAALGQVAREEGFTAQVIDCFLRKWSAAEAAAAVPDDALVLAMTLMSANSSSAVSEIIASVRQRIPTIQVVLGGAAPTLTPHLFKQNEISGNTIYEGSNLDAWRHLLRHVAQSSFAPRTIQAGILDRGPEAILWRPDISYAFTLDPVVSLEASRGCHARCNFCAIYAEHKQAWLPKSQEHLSQEFDFIQETLPDCRELRFVDANFFGLPLSGSRVRAIAIAQEAHARDLRFRIECRANEIEENTFEALHRYGLVGLFVGLESGSDQMLRGIRKDMTSKRSLRAVALMRTLGLGFSYGFMMMSPHAREDDLLTNIDFLAEVGEGVRLKHLFGGIIRQEGTEFGKRGIAMEKANRRLGARLGYMPENQACQNLVHVWDQFCSKHSELLNQEHIVGVSLDRGKETRNKRFFALDTQFSAALLSWFEALLNDVRHPDLHVDDVGGAIDTHVEKLKAIVIGTLRNIKAIGLPGHVRCDCLYQDIVRDDEPHYVV